MISSKPEVEYSADETCANPLAVIGMDAAGPLDFGDDPSALPRLKLLCPVDTEAQVPGSKVEHLCLYSPDGLSAVALTADTKISVIKVLQSVRQLVEENREGQRIKKYQRAHLGGSSTGMYDSMFKIWTNAKELALALNKEDFWAGLEATKTSGVIPGSTALVVVIFPDGRTTVASHELFSSQGGYWKAPYSHASLAQHMAVQLGISDHSPNKEQGQNGAYYSKRKFKQWTAMRLSTVELNSAEQSIKNQKVAIEKFVRM